MKGLVVGAVPAHLGAQGCLLCVSLVIFSVLKVGGEKQDHGHEPSTSLTPLSGHTLYAPGWSVKGLCLDEHNDLAQVTGVSE